MHAVTVFFPNWMLIFVIVLYYFTSEYIVYVRRKYASSESSDSYDHVFLLSSIKYRMEITCIFLRVWKYLFNLTDNSVIKNYK